MISDVLFATFDFGTAVLCQSMIYTKLLPDSRGVISSIILLSTTLFGISQALLTIQIQDGYNTDIDGVKATNFIAGGKQNVSVYVISQFILFVATAIWQLIELFKPKKTEEKEDDF